MSSMETMTPKNSTSKMYRQKIIDFIQFEDETSEIWPWAISAEKLIQDGEALQKIAEITQFDESGQYDTDDLYSAINQVAGINPALQGGIA